MPASSEFIRGVLDIIQRNANSASFNDEWCLQFVESICELPANNQSVLDTQTMLLAAAYARWSRH